MRIKSVMFAGVLLTGCATVEVPINSTFSASDVAWFSQSGDNTIEGSAFLRTKGGDVKTCAGFDITLIPYSDYAAERMQYLYGNEEEGYRSNGLQRKFEFSNNDPKYLENSKTTKCDAQGEFKFANLPDGDYYVTGGVSWMASSQIFQEGAALMKKVSIEGGETESVTLTAT